MGIDTTRAQQGKHKAEMCSGKARIVDGDKGIRPMIKTLDEVIEKIEEFWVCPCVDEANEYCDLMEVREDALHYLKKYQWQMTNPDGDHQQLLKCQALLQDFYRSEPLTWDELYSRNGMPVWIEDSFDNGEWYIIECFTASNRFVAHDRWGDTTLFNKKEMDDVWKAYRREHHEN